MISFAFSCLSHHRGVIGDAETPRFPCSQQSHGTPCPKSPARRPTHHSTPTRSQAGDLVGKYGCDRVRGNTSFPAVDHTEHQVLVSRQTTDPPFLPPPGDLTLGTLSKDRSLRSESKRPVERPGNSTLGTLLKDRSPRSESKRLVERPSSSDTGHSARLATKGSVQQSLVNRPVYSEHVPVTPGPDKPGTGQMTGTGTRYPVLGFTDHTV